MKNFINTLTKRWWGWFILLCIWPFILIYYVYKGITSENKTHKIAGFIGAFIIICAVIYQGTIGREIEEQKAIQAATQKEQKLQQDEENKKQEKLKKEEDEKKKAEEVAIAAANSNQTVNGELKVHFINVGQADSILVQQGSQALLVDAGNNSDGDTVKSYLSSQGIKSLDFLIGTHPHEDHIGGMDYVINSFKVGKIFMPKTTSNTKTFEDVVNAAKAKNLSFTAPTPGDSFKVGEATCTILAPNRSGYEDPNNYSIVLKVSFGSTSFLLSGDAEEISENEMISKGVDLSSTVLKVGHHGSDSSTTSNYLTKVSPKYAVLSVGKDNSYGHPKQSVMDRLKSKSIEVYRTDENGTIVATSNGTTVTFNTKPGSYTGVKSSESTNSNSSSGSSGGNSGGTSTPAPAPITPAPSTGGTVYWLTTKTSKSYHKNPNCSYIAGKKVNSGSVQDAINAAHSDPCNKCAQ